MTMGLIYQEIYQNHPAMANAVENDLARIANSGVLNFKPEKPAAADSTDVTSAQKMQLERYDQLLKEREENRQRGLGRSIQAGQLTGGERAAASLSSAAAIRAAESEDKRIQEEIDALLNDPVIGPLIRDREAQNMRPSNEGYQQRPQQGVVSENDLSVEEIEDVARNSQTVIAELPGDMRDEVISKINEALPERLYAFETENSMGEKAIGFKNEAGEDTGEMIFFS